MRPLALLALLAAGCGGPPSARPTGPPPLVVRITLDGQPAGRLSVQLLAADGKPAGGGVADEAGVAAVAGVGGQPLAPGTYKVAVSDLGEAEENPMEQVRAAPKSRVPVAYARPGSPLSLTVEAGKTEYQLALKSKP